VNADADSLDLALRRALAGYPRRIVACSGGIDSLLLATVAHDAAPGDTIVAHAVAPAVPAVATSRVLAAADRYGWDLEVVRTREFEDERYLRNPRNRCYFCKVNLYDELARVAAARSVAHDWRLLSGTNTDDLGEYRPGLVAAGERAVAHPYVEAGLAKQDVRSLARHLGLEWADLPAAPCLASRLYTGTRVTAARLRAVEVGEELIRAATGIGIVRCRIDDDRVFIEVQDEDRALIDEGLRARVTDAMRAVAPALEAVGLDVHAYRPGRAFLPVA